MRISRQLRRAVNSVYQQIGGDLPEDIDTESIAEICCDADRLTMFGHPEADAEWKRLNREFGYDAVLKELAKNL